MKATSAVFLFLVLFAGTSTAGGSQRWSFEPRAGLAAPTERLEGGKLKIGIGLGATVAYRLQPHLHFYTGWGWHHFAADASLENRDADLEQTGYVFGLGFVHPFGDASSLAYRLSAGGTYEHLEIEETTGRIGDSGHGVGWEVGAGLVVPWRQGWELSPAIGYRSLSRDINVGPATRCTNLRYIVIDVGMTRRF